MSRIARALAPIAVVLVIGGLAAAKWWVVFGQKPLGAACETRAGCRSMYCLAHVRKGDAEVKSAGYCSASCEGDGDCAEAGLKCVVPTQAALDDLPSLGRPAKLCMRVE